MNLMEQALFTGLKKVKHEYIITALNNGKEKELLTELVQDIRQGNEITLQKLIGKDNVNLLKLLYYGKGY
jgi:hypothetical protein